MAKASEFPQRGYTNGQHERCSKLVIKEMQIKTTRHHFIGNRMPIIRKTVTSVVKDMEKLKFLGTAGEYKTAWTNVKNILMNESSATTVEKVWQFLKM